MSFRTLIVSLVGFQQLLDDLKLAILEKTFIPFISFILIINQRNSEFFSRQARANQLSLLNPIYILGLAHQFWMDLNNSLMLPRDLFLKSELICYF